ncbi:MAG: LysM peptidoglycan-binding domain-containing protein, partial [Bacteroidota bacterium]
MINPKSYKLSSAIQYFQNQTINSTGVQKRFKFVPPKSLTISFTLDGTGVTGRGPDVDGVQNFLNKIPSNPIAGILNDSVEKSVKKFFRICQKMHPDNHDVPYLIISWGPLVYRCRLKTADVNYEMFTLGGEPLRATISATFCAHVDNKKRTAEEGKNSPDLTHIITVKEGDTLPRLTRKIYGTTQYYLDVARVNNLTNYRRLVPGTELIFPPIDKTATA